VGRLPTPTAEGIAEGAFLLVVAATFGYLLVASRGWPASAALVPTLIGCVGLPLLAIHVLRRWRELARPRPAAGPILDVGFTDVHLERRVVTVRTVQMLGSTAALFVGIWLVGFHVALPLFVGLYLLVFGRVRWWWALLGALVFEGLLLGLYDGVLHIAWNVPVLQQIFGGRP
jgi:hypothetical protein